MNLTLKGIGKICPRLITKQHLLAITSDFFQTDIHPTVGTDVNRDHNKTTT